MTATSFKCSTCGGDIPLGDFDVLRISKCPYCNKNFYINEDYEESVKVATKRAEQVVLESVHDINIPEISEKILRKDLEQYRRVVESITFLDGHREMLEKKKAENNEEVKEVEQQVGLDYKELTDKTPEAVSGALFFGLAAGAYAISGLLMGIIATANSPYSSRVIQFIFAVVFWPVFALAPSGCGSVYETEILQALPIFVFLFLIAALPLLQYMRRMSFQRKLDGEKKNLDLQRIEKRKRLLEENIHLTRDITILRSAIAALYSKQSSANILKMTGQLDGLRGIKCLKKIEFASKRMQAAPIDFEMACAGFSPDEATYKLPFPAGRIGDDVKQLISNALTHIKSDAYQP